MTKYQRFLAAMARERAKALFEGDDLSCPGCGRRITARQPARGDGIGVRLKGHKVRAADRRQSPTICPWSDQLVVRVSGRWQRSEA